MFLLLPLLLSLQSPPPTPSETTVIHTVPAAADLAAENTVPAAALQTPYVRVIGRSSELGGQLLGWSAQGPELAQDFSTDDWLVVDFLNPGTSVASWTMELNNGSWLPGHPAPLLGALPAWQLAGLADVAPMPLDTLWLRSFGVDRHPRAQDDKDQLWVSTAAGGVDRQRGYLLEWRAGGLLFETAGGEREFPWERLLGLGLLEEQATTPPNSVWIQLTNGGVISARIGGISDGAIELLLPWDQPWSLPLTAVQRVRRRGQVEELAVESAWQVVSNPVSEVLNWSPRFGKSIEGRPLRLGSGVFAQGIGVKVPTTLRHEVHEAGLLLLTVGVDREVEHFRDPQAVIFEVWLDDIKLTSSGSRLFSHDPLVLKVTVPKAGSLKLVARPAGALPFGGHADFADVIWIPK